MAARVKEAMERADKLTEKELKVSHEELEKDAAEASTQAG
jgi:hypothetical protein